MSGQPAKPLLLTNAPSEDLQLSSATGQGDSAAAARVGAGRELGLSEALDDSVLAMLVLSVHDTCAK